MTNTSRRGSRRSCPPLTPLFLHVDEVFQALVLLDTQSESIRADAVGGSSDRSWPSRSRVQCSGRTRLRQSHPHKERFGKALHLCFRVVSPLQRRYGAHGVAAFFANTAGSVDECHCAEVYWRHTTASGYGSLDAVVYAELVDHEADLWC